MQFCCVTGSGPLSPRIPTMHALWPRVNQLSTHVMTMLAVLVFAGSVSSYARLSGVKPSVALSLHGTPKLRRLQQERCDQAMLRLNLDADLSALWSWNTKYVFVYVVASYASKSHKRNEVVVWDDILSDPAEAETLQKKGFYNKYSLKDHGFGLKGTDVELSFRWSIMPYMGALMYGETGGEKFQLPSAYAGVKTSY